MEKHEKILFIIAIFILIYLLIIFIFIPSRANAGEVHGHLAFGYIPETDDYCTELIVSYEFWVVILQGGIETLMEPSPESALFFCPYRNTYYFDLILQPFKHIYFNFSHSCTHPVFSYSKQFYDKFEGGNRTTFFVGIKW